MAVGKGGEGRMAPVHLFSHGSTMMLGEESASATYWKKCGDEALARGVEHVVIMVRFPLSITSHYLYHTPYLTPSLPPLANTTSNPLHQGAHWATTLPGIVLSANPTPTKSPVAYVHPSKYEQYALQPDLEYVPTLRAHLGAGGGGAAGGGGGGGGRGAGRGRGRGF